jgi:hypothetical protein
MFRAAVVLAGLVCVAPIARAQAPASPPPPASPASVAPSWKLIYENSQTAYYFSADVPQQAGESDIVVLTEYKIPQVMDGVQVWSIVSNMKVKCDAARMATIDSTPHVLQMGAGRAVPMQVGQDVWHQPQPGSLGELIWNAVCVKK